MTKDDMQRLAHHLTRNMRGSSIGNYICPGMRSTMLAERPDGACVRMFEAERDTREFPITPHSHGYDFAALVLEGSVINTMYYREDTEGFIADKKSTALYAIGYLRGRLGQYEVERPPAENGSLYFVDDTPYEAGETYDMTWNQIHSITFGAGSKVLMFCGPRVEDTTTFLEPWVLGWGRVPLFETKAWMYQK
jgi:hypothetical protein